MIAGLAVVVAVVVAVAAPEGIPQAGKPHPQTASPDAAQNQSPE
jgi:hypothetical protein